MYISWTKRLEKSNIIMRIYQLDSQSCQQKALGRPKIVLILTLPYIPYLYRSICHSFIDFLRKFAIGQQLLRETLWKLRILFLDSHKFMLFHNKLWYIQDCYFPSVLQIYLSISDIFLKLNEVFLTNLRPYL